MARSTFRRRRRAAEADPEAVLVDRLRAMEAEAWGELYDRHHVQIWRYVHGRTGNRDLADDVAAQVFVEALESIRHYRYTGKPVLAWLYAIARNHTAKRLRTARREVPAARDPAGASPEDRLDAIALAAALRRLTSDQREVLVLRFYAGFATREIARILGKSETAVYSLEVRAIAALRRRLAPGPDEISTPADEKGRSGGIT